MSWIVLLTQVVLPLMLLVWVALRPADGVLAFGLQLVAVGSALLGIALAALWTMPPFWTPWAYGLALVVISVWHLARGGRRARGLWQMSTVQTFIMLPVAGLGLLGGYLSLQALQGRVLPAGEVVDIAAPFPPGRYLVAHGGSTETVNNHLGTLDTAVPRFLPWRGQSKALDLFRIGTLGLHKDGWLPTDAARYATFGTPVLAPCAGTVARAVDGVADMPVPKMDRDHMAGNYIALDCGDFFVVLAHLRRGSVAVTESERVAVGDTLGQMGNSGNSSEPHLHVHAQKGLPRGAPLGGEPLWLTVNGRFPVRNDIIRVRRDG